MSENRVTNERTGGQKNQKPEQLHHLDWNALLQVGAVASHGGQKYSPYNYRRGIQFSLHFDALMRHLGQFWEGEDVDEESGQHHVAHAAWHCLALLSQHRLSEKAPDLRLDDRPHKALAPAEVPTPKRWNIEHLNVGYLSADKIRGSSITPHDNPKEN